MAGELLTRNWLPRGGQLLQGQQGRRCQRIGIQKTKDLGNAAGSLERVNFGFPASVEEEDTPAGSLSGHRRQCKHPAHKTLCKARGRYDPVTH